MSRLKKIKEQLAELGISPKRSLGQNFLIGDSTINKIVDAVKKQSPTTLVEVGPGLGAITEELLKLECPFQVIELDRAFSQMWRERGVNVTEGDAIKIDWSSLSLQEGSGLVSNLPYQIGGHIVVDRSVQPYGLQFMVLMFQKEVAQRIMAQPSTSDYGFLSIVAQSFWELSIVAEAGPGQFYPPPNVSSRVLMFQRKPQAVEKPEEFVGFVKSAFSQRRKFLVKNLKAILGELGKEKLELVELLQEMGLSDKVRAEELSVEQFNSLYSQLYERN